MQKKTRTKTAWWLAAVAVLTSVPATFAAPPSVGLTDRVTAATDPSRAVTSGDVRHETVGDFVGGHDTRRPAWTLGRGGAIEWKASVVPDQPLLLEIEEIYGRDADVRGYSIFVNGTRTYFRTFRGCGAGPVHYFVQIPAQPASEITIRVANDHDVPVSISRAWCFSGFAEYFRASSMAVPYAFAPTIGMSFDFEKDIAKLLTVKASMSDSPHARAAWTTWLGYANLSAFETRRQIDYALRLAREADMPVQLSFDMWWGNSPGGSDGKGGNWADVRYQQIVFNETTKKFHLSIPNRWSNTPWRTMNDPDLNAYKTRRLTDSMTYLRQRVNAMTASGAANPILSVNLDNEPVYWASGNAGLGNDELWADFNPHVIKDAAKDGVKLDPVDGLARDERAWLHRNILNYNKFTADAALAGLARDAVLVKGDVVQPAGDPLASNVYTQAFVADPTLQFPLLEPSQGLWETAAPGNVRVGGEYNGDSQVELEAITHHIALGRSAAVNAEAGNRDEAIGSVAPGFAFGLRYWTPYNWPLDKMETAVHELADQSRTLSPRLYERRLVEDEFRGDVWKSHVVSHGGVEAKILGNTAAMALAPVSPDAPGHLTYRVQAPAGGSFEGLAIELNGRAFVSKKKDANVHIRVMAGTQAEAEAMQEVKRIFDVGDINEVWRIDLSALARDKRGVFVRLELHAPGLSGEHLSWCSVRRVAFTVPWPKALTDGGAKQDDSIATLRTQNLIVAWRTDAEQAIATLAAAAGKQEAGAAMWKGQPDASPPARLEQARAAYDGGRYAEAYRMANEGSGVALPARYHVQASGPLHPYPVRIDAMTPLVCEVREWSESAVRLALVACGEQAVAAKVTLSRQQPGARYTVTKTPEGDVRMARDAAGTVVADAEGNVRVDVEASAESPMPRPKRVVGSLKSADATAKQVHIIQDNGDGAQGVTFDDATVFTLRDPSTGESRAKTITFKQILRGDQLTVEATKAGVAGEVSVERRMLEGEVQAIAQMTTTTMASLRVTGDDADHVIDLNAMLHLPEGDTTIRAQEPGTLELAVGDRVRVRLNPTSGRVVELWKQP